MIKTITLLHAKAGVSREEFMQRYENVHVPLVESELGRFLDYRRDYVNHEFLEPASELGERFMKPDFDVVTTIKHENAAALTRLNEALAQGSVRERISWDECQNFERQKMHMFMVSETNIWGDDPRKAASPCNCSIKLYFMGKATHSLRGFKGFKGQEAMNCALADKLVRPGLKRLSINRVPAGGVVDLQHIEGHVKRDDIDQIIEFDFADKDDFRKYLIENKDLIPEILNIFVDKEWSDGIMAFATTAYSQH